MILILVLIFLFTGWSYAGDSLPIGVQAATRPAGPAFVDPSAAEAYWELYPDVKADSYFGLNYDRAWQHYTQHGKMEGRVWSGPTPKPDIRILPSCGATNSGGYNCFRFMAEAFLSAIAWESTVKAGASEVLAFLYVNSPTVNKTLMSAHHLGVSSRIKTITLPDPIRIPAGAIVWIFAEGWSEPHDGGFESQTMLYFTGTAQAVIQQ